MNKKTTGEKIKSVRESKSISIEDLAKISGLTAEQIIDIEKDSLVSLAPLIKIARALGVRLGTFLDDSEVMEPVVYRSKTELGNASFSMGSAKAHSHINYFSLAQSKAGRYMEPFIIEINNADGGNFEFSSHEGEEFLYCLEGSFELIYGKKIYKIEQGESIYYDSVIEHRLQASGNGVAKVLAVVYAPV